MSERKVLNKYVSPQIDPRVDRGNRYLPSGGGGRSGHTVRLMAPFTMRCLTCSEWIHRGKKFNARKERAANEHYLGIQIFRFYIRCPLCASEITFKTDPKNIDYVAEHGALRNFEPWKDDILYSQQVEDERLAAEEANPMMALENRTMESKREMEILDALDELRQRNARHDKLTAEALEKFLETKDQKDLESAQKEEEVDLEEMKLVFKNAEGEKVKRVDEPPSLFKAPAAVLKRKGMDNLMSKLVKRRDEDTNSHKESAESHPKESADSHLKETVHLTSQKTPLLALADYDSD